MSEFIGNYTPPISMEKRMLYEGALAYEQRWQNGMQIALRPENDLDHVNDGIGIFKEMKQKRPNLAASVEEQVFLDMYYFHDGGEILAHDLTHSHPQYDVLRPRVKTRERAAVRLLTRDYIDDPVVRNYIRNLYARYEKPQPGDRESYMAHLVDKVQGFRFGREFVFNGKRMTEAQRLQQLNHSFEIIKSPARSLFALVERPAQEELRDFVSQEFKAFSKFGYLKRETEYYIRQVEESLSHE